jgi:hypothetical protein
VVAASIRIPEYLNEDFYRAMESVGAVMVRKAVGNSSYAFIAVKGSQKYKMK